MTYILGIDPGNSGAIAVLDQRGALIEVFDMPVVEVVVGKATKRRLSPELLAAELRNWAPETAGAVIEQVASSPQMGVSSAFAFGEGYGIVKGVLAGLGIPCRGVLPAVWKKAMKLNASKDGSRMRAIQQWPQQAGEFKRARDDGRAEAALIALYSIEKHTA